MASALISKESITCPICVDVFNNPRMLPCGHSLCYICIKKLISSTIKNKLNAVLFQCPSCRANVEIPPDIPGRERAEHFARNHILHSLVSEYVETKNTAEVKDDQETPSECVSHNEEIKLYCKDHSIAVCSMCVFLEHRQCENVITLEDTMKDITPLLTDNIDKITDVQNRTRVLKENFESMTVMLDSSAALCHQEIDALFEEIIQNALDRKEELHVIVNEKKESEEKVIKKQSLSVHKLMDEIAQTKARYEKSPSEIGALLLQLKNQNDLDENIERWHNNIIHIFNSGQSSMLRFTPDKRIADFLKLTGDIGEVNKMDSAKLPMPLKTDGSSAYSSAEDITLPVPMENKEEIQGPNVFTTSGLTLTNKQLCGIDKFPIMSFYDEKHVVVCFENSTNLLLVTVDNFIIENQVPLPLAPWDIAVYDQYVAITHSAAKAISILKLPSLELKCMFNSNLKCNGIDRFHGKFVISCLHDGCVQLLSNKGTLLLETPKIFESPECVSASEKDHCIFVSDTASRSVYCLNSRLTLKWVFKRELLTYPRGLCALDGGNVIVACLWTNKIVELDSQGKYKRTILNEKDGILKPKALHLNTAEKLMIVCESSGSIKMVSLL